MLKFSAVDNYCEMQMNASMMAFDVERGMVTRAAWLHFVGGLKQSDVAKTLGVPNIKAHRLISKAVKQGVVKFAIDGDVAECAIYEDSLRQAFELSYCEVIPAMGDSVDLIASLGVAGASYLKREVLSGNNRVIGVGHGRTLSSAVEQLPRMDSRSAKFVSLMGGLMRNYAANPHDVMYRLAAKTNADAFVMPVPFFANSIQDCQVMLNQKGVHEIRRMASSATINLVGIGTTDSNTHLVQSGMIEQREIDAVREKGGVGELLGEFFDENGNLISTELSARTVSVGLKSLGTGKIIALAGGKDKLRAIGSVLNSGHLSGLITDERTAASLLKL